MFTTASSCCLPLHLAVQLSSLASDLIAMRIVKATGAIHHQRYIIIIELIAAALWSPITIVRSD